MDNTAGHKQSKRFLECVGNKFLLQVPERKCAMMDLVFINKEWLAGKVKLKGSPGCTAREMVEFT